MVARSLALFVAVALMAQCWLAYTVTGILPGYAGSFYWFTIPHLLVLPLGAVMVIMAALIRSPRISLAGMLCVSAILPTWLFAALSWPGGDDGPGMAWWFGVGLASLLTTCFALPVAYYARKRYTRST